MQNSTLSTLKDNLNIITELIIDKNDVFYIDIPFYFNVGDLLIYHGTERYFEQNGITPKLRACILSFDLEKAKQLITEKTTIICQGGGNFGGIYTNHQNIRETIIRHFPNNRVM